MKKQKEFFDQQLQHLQERHKILSIKNKAQEQEILDLVQTEIKAEKNKKLLKLKSQRKEYLRLLKENETAKEKAIEKKEKQLQYDIKWLKFQDELLQQQENKRKQEKEGRENNIKARMSKMEETGTYTQNEL